MEINKSLKISYFLRTILTVMAVYSLFFAYLLYRDTTPFVLTIISMGALVLALIIYFVKYKNASFEPAAIVMNFLFFGFTILGCLLVASEGTRLEFRIYTIYVAVQVILFIFNLFYASLTQDGVRNSNQAENTYSVEHKESKRVFFMFSGILSIFLFVVCLIPFTGLGSFINNIMRNLFHFKNAEYIPPEDTNEKFEEIEDDSKLEGQLGEEHQEYFNDIIKIVVIILAILLLIFVCYMIFKALMARLEDYLRYKNEIEEPIIEDGVVITKKSLEREEEKDKLNGLFVRNPRKQVRLAFIKAVKCKRKRNIKLYMVPMELIEERPDGPEATLRALYERAKYSENIITKDDAIKARECLALIKKTY